MIITLTAQNWQTTIGGLLAGIPVIVINSGLALTMKETQILAIIGAVGTLFIGLAAKDSGTHSTMQQVQASSAKAAGIKN